MTSSRAPTRHAIDSFTEIATLRIELKDSDPLIWRVVEVHTSITLKVLHEIVQVTMGRLDYHLWEFVTGGQSYGLPMDEGWGAAPRKVASRVRLRDVLSPGTTTIDYTYDFGDNWEHRLVVSDVRRGPDYSRRPVPVLRAADLRCSTWVWRRRTSGLRSLRASCFAQSTTPY